MPTSAGQGVGGVASKHLLGAGGVGDGDGEPLCGPHVGRRCAPRRNPAEGPGSVLGVKAPHRRDTVVEATTTLRLVE